MGGDGSGNQGRKKFGNKFYEKETGYPTKERAEHSARQMEAIGIKTKIVKEVYETPWPPHDDVNGYVIYYIPTYHRKSRKEKNMPASGSRRFYNVR